MKTPFKMKVYLLKIVENIVVKQEIAYAEHYLLLPQCFQNVSILVNPF